MADQKGSIDTPVRSGEATALGGGARLLGGGAYIHTSAESLDAALKDKADMISVAEWKGSAPGGHYEDHQIEFRGGSLDQGVGYQVEETTITPPLGAVGIRIKLAVARRDRGRPLRYRMTIRYDASDQPLYVEEMVSHDLLALEAAPGHSMHSVMVKRTAAGLYIAECAVYTLKQQLQQQQPQQQQLRPIAAQPTPPAPRDVSGANAGDIPVSAPGGPPA